MAKGNGDEIAVASRLQSNVPAGRQPGRCRRRRRPRATRPTTHRRRRQDDEPLSHTGWPFHWKWKLKSSPSAASSSSSVVVTSRIGLTSFVAVVSCPSASVGWRASSKSSQLCSDADNWEHVLSLRHCFGLIFECYYGPLSATQALFLQLRHSSNEHWPQRPQFFCWIAWGFLWSFPKRFFSM